MNKPGIVNFRWYLFFFFFPRKGFSCILIFYLNLYFLFFVFSSVVKLLRHIYFLYFTAAAILCKTILDFYHQHALLSNEVKNVARKNLFKQKFLQIRISTIL